MAAAEPRSVAEPRAPPDPQWYTVPSEPSIQYPAPEAATAPIPEAQPDPEEPGVVEGGVGLVVEVVEVGVVVEVVVALGAFRAMSGKLSCTVEASPNAEAPATVCHEEIGKDAAAEVVLARWITGVDPGPDPSAS